MLALGSPLLLLAGISIFFDPFISLTLPFSFFLLWFPPWKWFIWWGGYGTVWMYFYLRVGWINTISRLFYLFIYFFVSAFFCARIFHPRVRFWFRLARTERICCSSRRLYFCFIFRFWEFLFGASVDILIYGWNVVTALNGFLFFLFSLFWCSCCGKQISVVFQIWAEVERMLFWMINMLFPYLLGLAKYIQVDCSKIWRRLD